MGIIRAIGQAIGGTLADQWLEVIEADDMSDKTVFTSGVLIRKGQNLSLIHIWESHRIRLMRLGI